MLAYSLVRCFDEHIKYFGKASRWGGGKFMVQAFRVQALL
jgi:hypothetical protein